MGDQAVRAAAGSLRGARPKHENGKVGVRKGIGCMGTPPPKKLSSKLRRGTGNTPRRGTAPFQAEPSRIVTLRGTEETIVQANANVMPTAATGDRDAR